MISQKNKKLIAANWPWILLGGFIIISVVFYICRFSNQKISNSPTDWGVFGDYIGGLIGTIIALANLLVFVQLTNKVAQIQNEAHQQVLQQQQQISLMQNEFNTQSIRQQEEANKQQEEANKLVIYSLHLTLIENLRNHVLSYRFADVNGTHAFYRFSQRIANSQFDISTEDEGVYIYQVGDLIKRWVKIATQVSLLSIGDSQKLLLLEEHTGVFSINFKPMLLNFLERRKTEKFNQRLTNFFTDLDTAKTIYDNLLTMKDNIGERLLASRQQRNL
jgi:uncharacterized membrane protein